MTIRIARPLYAAKDYPDKLRRIKYYDAKTNEDEMDNRLNLFNTLMGH